SLVQFIDGSIIGEFGTPNMDRYLQYALFHPDRKPTSADLKLDLINQHLSFLPPDVLKFPVLNVIPQLLKNPAMNLPAVWHGLDRVLVDAFIAQTITFPQISDLLIQGIEQFTSAYQGEDNILLKNALKAEEKGAQIATNLLSHV
ncbi:hypothetical protein FWH30_02840, partial [Microgenomates group bacterium]|nr:hypothetical protein [Microgenomates group bacterium]